MNLFGLYVPGSSGWHRVGPGWKYLVLLLLTAPALLANSPPLSLVALAASAIVLASCRIGVTRSLSLPFGFLLMVALLGAYQLLTGHLDLAVVLPANLIAALYATRLVTMTTPGPVLIDALVAACRPLRLFGASPQRLGLAVAVMLRAVPLLIDSIMEVRTAARARGRERSPLALITPVVVRAIGQAQASGEALAARGLGEA